MTPDQINLLVYAFRNVEEKDWEHLFSYIPDSGHGRFWKSVFGEVRSSLGATPSTLTVGQNNGIENTEGGA